MTEMLLKLATAALESGRIPPGLVHSSRYGGLDKVASSLLFNKGGPAGAPFDIQSALKSLGKEIYIKRAEWGMVAKGIEALRGLPGGD